MTISVQAYQVNLMTAIHLFWGHFRHNLCQVVRALWGEYRDAT